jgi:hypothetical protein
MRRAVLALLAIPLLVFPIYLLVVSLLQLRGEPFGYASAVGFWVWLALGSYPIVLNVGLPAFLLAKRYGRPQLWHALVVGALGGFVVVAGPALGNLFNDRLHLWFRIEQLASAYPFVITGVVIGGVYWFLAFWHNLALGYPTFRPHTEPSDRAA